MVMEMWELGYDHGKVKALKGGLSRRGHLKFPLVGTDVDSSKPKQEAFRYLTMTSRPKS